MLGKGTQSRLLRNGPRCAVPFPKPHPLLAHPQGKSVTHVPGTKCYLCVRLVIQQVPRVPHRTPLLLVAWELHFVVE